MDIQAVYTTIGPDLILQIKQIMQNHYSLDLYHYYITITNHNFQPKYITLVLYNMLE